MRVQASSAQTAFSGTQAFVGDYLELTKPSVVWLILMSTGIGFYMASVSLDILGLLHALLGTALLAAGTGALNQWLERETDGKMRRTENRPLPAGRVRSGPACAFGALLSASGLGYLLFVVNPLTALLGLITWVSYLGLYTPLKTRTWLSTFVGSFPGAMPPLIGWAAARNDITVEALVLFAVLFLWQFPHFYAIAWMYREDYARAGIQMLPVVERDGVSTGRQIVWYAALLVPVSVAPTWLGAAGTIYLAAALVLSLAYLYAGINVARAKTGTHAKRLLQASVLYLPLLYVFLVVDKA